MEKEELKDKALHNLFTKLSEEELPSCFNERIMQKVYREQKRKEWRNLLIVSLTSVCMLVAAIYTLVHYLSFSFANTFGGIFKKPENDWSSGLTFYVFIGVIILLLLGIDRLLRQHLKRFK